MRAKRYSHDDQHSAQRRDYNNNNNNNNVSLVQLQTNAAKDNQQHLPRRTVHYTQFSTVMQTAIQGR